MDVWGIEHRDVVIVLADGQRDCEGGDRFGLKAFMMKEKGAYSVVNCTLVFALQRAEHCGKPQSIRLVSVYATLKRVPSNEISCQMEGLIVYNFKQATFKCTTP